MTSLLRSAASDTLALASRKSPARIATCVCSHAGLKCRIVPRTREAVLVDAAVAHFSCSACTAPELFHR